MVFFASQLERRFLIDIVRVRPKSPVSTYFKNELTQLIAPNMSHPKSDYLLTIFKSHLIQKVLHFISP